MNERRTFLGQLFGGFIAWLMGWGTAKVTGGWEKSVTTSMIVPVDTIREAMTGPTEIVDCEASDTYFAIYYRGHEVLSGNSETLSIDATTQTDDDGTILGVRSIIRIECFQDA